MSTRTQTVVFTDLANYTAKVSRTDREGLRRILAEHEESVKPVVERYGGRIVKNLGDSYLILFDSATDAVRAALDIQHLVMSQGEIAIRLGMTTGDVEAIDGDAFGCSGHERFVHDGESDGERRDSVWRVSRREQDAQVQETSFLRKTSFCMLTCLSLNCKQ